MDTERVHALTGPLQETVDAMSRTLRLINYEGTTLDQSESIELRMVVGKAIADIKNLLLAIEADPPQTGLRRIK